MLGIGRRDFLKAVVEKVVVIVDGCRDSVIWCEACSACS